MYEGFQVLNDHLDDRYLFDEDRTPVENRDNERMAITAMTHILFQYDMISGDHPARELVHGWWPTMSLWIRQFTANTLPRVPLEMESVEVSLSALCIAFRIARDRGTKLMNMELVSPILSFWTDIAKHSELAAAVEKRPFQNTTLYVHDLVDSLFSNLPADAGPLTLHHAVISANMVTNYVDGFISAAESYMQTILTGDVRSMTTEEAQTCANRAVSTIRAVNQMCTVPVFNSLLNFERTVATAVECFKLPLLSIVDEVVTPTVEHVRLGWDCVQHVHFATTRPGAKAYMAIAINHGLLPTLFCFKTWIDWAARHHHDQVRQWAQDIDRYFNTFITPYLVYPSLLRPCPKSLRSAQLGSLIAELSPDATEQGPWEIICDALAKYGSILE